MKNNLNFLSILFCIMIFVFLSVIYCFPILLSKQIIQPDIINYIGGSKKNLDFRKKFKKESYWNNSMFSGMPTYQLGAEYPLDILKYIDKFLRFLPRPADYLFLFFIGFFLLGIIIIKKWEYALLGASMFGLSSYFFIILEIGHNAKAHAIGYFAPIFSGLYLLFNQKKKLLGFFITTIFLGLELMANHIQMTYYLFFPIGFFIIIELYYANQNKNIKSFITSFSIFIISGIFAIGMNYSRLLSTYEYMKESTRGRSTLTEKNILNEGLDIKYITEWSYGKLETLNLFIPNFMGGSTISNNFKAKELKKVINENFNKNEENQIISQLSSPYWGEQYNTSPAYQGAIVIFLAFYLSFFIPNQYLLWIIPSIIISILLAWGKNLMILSTLFIKYFPFYNKFRSVSSFMVIPEFLIPLLVMIGLYYYINNTNQIKKKKKLYIIGLPILIILVILYFFGEFFFNFTNSYEEKAKIPQILLNALRKDRIEIYKLDILRTFSFCIITFFLLLIQIHNKISSKILIYGITLLSIYDLWTVNKRFLNDNNFISSLYLKNLFPITVNEKIIHEIKNNIKLQHIILLSKLNSSLYNIKKQDNSIYRVFNTCLPPFNENNTSYFHYSIGGYHGAKLKKYEEIIEKFLNVEEEKINIEILNMLNTKYIFFGHPFEPQIIKNYNANGNAWFISNIIFAKNSNQELKILETINTKKETVIQEKYKLKITHKNNIYQNPINSNALIKLKQYQPNYISYESKNNIKQFCVFSEIFYPYGWHAYIDGKFTQHFPVNYILRGLEIPKGIHKIEFKFDPEVIQKGRIITLITFITFITFFILNFLYYRNIYCFTLKNIKKYNFLKK